ncbi:hypothetical protein M0L20_08175 [Spirosoma sp. RP8]|uniref:Lipoprotein n=1 Tax=Spirosoma liriopis TaxID=2937440 RepID=A0ABT0HJQ5_9BACT|nr:hypothetical protein [Spirosoma liriopis]MCK8491825.1 hypothetical protein [Spirosoma liriopis]
MKKQLLYFIMLGATTSMTACQQEHDIQPDSSLAGEVAGNYRTNYFLDPSCVAVPTNKMPSAELRAESDSAVTLIYTKSYPDKEVRQIEHVRLTREADAVQLRLADSSIGSLQTDRVFTDNGMEKQGKILRISIQPDNGNAVYFAGYKK